jgi:hypothetical protein
VILIAAIGLALWFTLRDRAERRRFGDSSAHFPTATPAAIANAESPTPEPVTAISASAPLSAIASEAQSEPEDVGSAAQHSRHIEAWEGPLLPVLGKYTKDGRHVVDRRALLGVGCNPRAEAPQWEGIERSETLGLTKGDRVVVLADGRVREARFGEVACGDGSVPDHELEGCDAWFVTISLEPPLPSASRQKYGANAYRGAAIASPDFLASTARVSPAAPERADDGCKPPPKIVRESSSKTNLGRLVSMSCQRQDVGGVALEVISAKITGEEGDYSYAFARGTAGDWVEVFTKSDRDVEPFLLIADPGGGGRVLFYSETGMGPAEMLRVVRVLPGGHVDAGRLFFSGGLPCD